MAEIISGLNIAIAPPTQNEWVEKCECGYRFGTRVKVIRQNGVFWVLELDFARGIPVHHIEAECPACHRLWSFHAQRKSKQAIFE